MKGKPTKLINSTKFFMTRKNIHYFFSLLIIFLIAVVITCLNLGITKEFVGDDAGVGYHYPNTLLNIAVNMWDSYTFPGKSNVIYTIAAIHIGSINLFNILGLTPIFIDRLCYFLFYFLSGLGMYLLSFHICNALFTTNKNKIWIASITGALFYMLNNFTMILLSFPVTSYVYSYILLPWIFLLYLKDYHLSSDLWKKIIFGITFLILLSGNPSNTISIVLLLLLYEFFFRENNKIIHNWKKFIPTLLLVLLLSSYIFLPILGNKENPYGKVSSSDNRISIQFSSSTTSLANLLRLRGQHSQDTFVFNEFLLSDKVIIVGYLLTAAALLLLFKKKIKRIEIFLFLTYILFLFLAKAEHYPLSWINRLIYTKVPLFEMYRASWYKFIYFCAFSISIMMSISILEIEKFLSKLPLSLFIKRVFLALPLLLIVFCAKPFFWGEVVRDVHKTTIPIEYHSINTYFSNDKTDFSVLSLPQLPSGLVLDWGNGNYYAGAHPDMFMLGNPVWSNSWFLSKSLINNNFSEYKEILNNTNIKYVLLHKDIPENYSFKVNMKGNIGGQTNFHKLDSQIMSDKDFKLIEDNNFFEVFEINQDEYKPHFYISRDATDSKLQAPTITFIKINPTKYRIKVEGAKEPYTLVFSESFNQGWKAYINEDQNDYGKTMASYFDGQVNEGTHKNIFIDKNIFETLGKRSVPEENHLLINGYFNSWYITPTDSGCSENYEIIIEFWPQRLFYIGLFISGLTSFGCLGYLIYDYLKKKWIFK